jgi:hypothetical protein
MGVIEGYYGQPWTFEERAACIDVLARHGGNTYVWAPKSEPRHRDAWREPFTPDELNGFAMLAARSPDVMVSIGLTPGDDASVDDVVTKLAPALGVGCHGITLCFDDLPELAAAERHRTISNGVAERTGATVWVVPTHYAGLSGSAYLTALLDGLRDDIAVMWTGEHVVTDRITVGDARARTAVTAGRAPLLWDNTPVNDALMTSLLHLGPYTGREPALRDHLSGLLLNPMPSMTASLPTIVSACAWWNGNDPQRAWEETVDELGLRHLAEATAFPGDPHWPGDVPSRKWLTAIAAMPDNDDPFVQPWIDAARAGARLSLAALDAIDALDAGARPSSLVGQFVQMTGLDGWLRSTVRTLGSGPRTRPVWTQDDEGHFAPTSDALVFTESIPERLVAAAHAALARHGAASNDVSDGT